MQGQGQGLQIGPKESFRTRTRTRINIPGLHFPQELGRALYFTYFLMQTLPLYGQIGGRLVHDVGYSMRLSFFRNRSMALDFVGGSNFHHSSIGLRRRLGRRNYNGAYYRSE